MTKFKLILAALIATVALNAQTGVEIYETKCAVCHKMKPMMDKAKMMAMTPQERMSMKEKMMKMMKAPPMNKISAKIKFELKDDKTAFVAFVKDYMVNPSKEKSLCMPMALEKFGVMPAIGKGMTETDIETIANWLHDNFTEKWNPNDMGMMCKSKGKGMKCGEGKCGGNMKSAAEATSKCAGKEKTAPKETPKSMKCGQGKCGSN